LASFDQVKSTVKERADIADYIGRHAKLVKTATGYKACCPLPGHKEKTPSFHVNTRDNFFYCYGCQRGGDVFTFLKLVEGVEFREALEELCDRYQIERPESGKPEQEESASLKKYKLGIAFLKRVSEFYHLCLKKKIENKDSKIINYLGSRGISIDLVEKYKLGWADSDQKENLLGKLKSSEEQSLAKELSLITNDYNFFTNRLIIPVTNAKSKVVGFSGRLLDKESKYPKYKNSAESFWFKKKKILYGLAENLRLIRQKDFVFLVEGFFDQWALDKLGLPAVAVMGTALTEEQLESVQKNTKHLYLLLDQDEAGIKAIIRSLPLMLKKEFRVKVVALPRPFKDPDEWISSLSAQGQDCAIITEKFNFIKESSMEGLQWWIQHESSKLKKKRANSLEQLQGLRDEIWVNLEHSVHKIYFKKELSKILTISEKELDLEFPSKKVFHNNQKVNNTLSKVKNFQLKGSLDLAAEKLFFLLLTGDSQLEGHIAKNNVGLKELAAVFEVSFFEDFFAFALKESEQNSENILSFDILRSYAQEYSELNTQFKVIYFKALVPRETQELNLSGDKLLNLFEAFKKSIMKEKVQRQLVALNEKIRSTPESSEELVYLLQEMQSLRLYLEKLK